MHLERTRIRPPRRALPALVLLFGLGGLLLAAGCGDDDNVNNNQPQVIVRDDVLRACLISDGCGVMPFAYASLCVEANWDQQYHTGTVPIWSTLYQCVLDKAGDCDQVQACFGGGSEPQACGSVADGYCDGSTRVYCDSFDQKLYSQYCGDANQSCVMSEVSQGILAPVCGLGTCATATDEAECRGNLLISCDAGALAVRDCSALGLICGDSATGTSKACVGDGDACDSYAYTPTCNGTVVTRCIQNRLNTFDCANLPGDKTCEPGRDQCVAAGTQCEPGQESCQTSTIRVCLDGSIHEIDCQDLGFTQCETLTGGAHCRP